jgi:hypothetical protein
MRWRQSRLATMVHVMLPIDAVVDRLVSVCGIPA